MPDASGESVKSPHGYHIKAPFVSIGHHPI
jgi:hypothetical protein